MGRFKNLVLFVNVQPLVASIFLGIVVLFVNHHVFAEVYKWIDDTGRVHYGDKPQRDAKLMPNKNRISSYDSVTFDRPRKSHVSGSTPVKGEKVVIYSTE